jgi:hypothetical protein
MTRSRLALAAVAVVVVLALWLWTRQAPVPPPAVARVAPSTTTTRPAQAPIASPPPTTTPSTTRPAAPPATLPPPRVRAPSIIERQRPVHWRLQAEQAIDHRIEEAGLQGRVTPLDRARLLIALARMRRTTRREGRIPPGVSAMMDERHARIKASADDLFRDKLGIGVDEFIASENVPPSPR